MRTLAGGGWGGLPCSSGSPSARVLGDTSTFINVETCTVLAMTLVIPEGFGSAIISLRWAGDPEPMAVTLGIAGDAANEDDVITAAGGISNAFKDNVMPLLADDVELFNVELTYQLTPLPDEPIIGISTQTEAGSQDGTLLPQNCAYLCHKRTASGGRGGRGRFYLPGVEEANVDNLGNIDGSFLTVANAALAVFLTDLFDAPVIQNAVVLHDSEGAFADADPHVITTMVMDPVIATQRRRLRR